jgi:endoglucanase
VLAGEWLKLQPMNRRETLLGAAALAACGPAGGQAQAPPFPMRRGVNLGNALEAPNEGEWGYRIEEAHLGAIKDAGFDGVRVPVRWDAHFIDDAGTINPSFFARVDQIIDQALAADLRVQLDLHHYDALVQGGLRAPHQNRFLSIWSQIAQRYRQLPNTLMFEPFNEPNGRQWDGRALIDLQRHVTDLIRGHSPERMIVLGPSNWQNIDALRDWRPPEGDNIAVSAHYYEPHAFTHQNAEWLGDDAPTFDRDWGAAADRRQVRDHIGQAARWAREHGYALQLGEFGVNGAVPVQQRAAWTRAVREACETEGVGWCVWDFAGAFPIWDRETRAFIPLMRDALFA